MSRRPSCLKASGPPGGRVSPSQPHSAPDGPGGCSQPPRCWRGACHTRTREAGTGRERPEPLPSQAPPCILAQLHQERGAVNQEWGATGRSLGAEVACSWQGAPGGGGGCLVWDGVATRSPCLPHPAQACRPRRQPAGACGHGADGGGHAVGRGGGKEARAGRMHGLTLLAGPCLLTGQQLLPGQALFGPLSCK